MTWRLLRLWHVEVLESVADRPNAVTFTRTSYCVAPERWAQLPTAELQRRSGTLVEASYRKRNSLTAQWDDPTGMVWIAYAYEWVAPHEMPGDTGDVAERVWLNANGEVAAELIAGAIEEIGALWRAPRPGVDRKPWQNAFEAWAIDAEGKNWNMLKYGEREGVFDERLGGSMLVDPIFADGAGLAARTKDEVLIGLPRENAEGLSPVTPPEYRELHSVGLGDPSLVARPNERIPLQFFSAAENTIAAGGPVVVGVGVLALDAARALGVSITPADGSKPRALFVSGVPLVAMRTPLQKERADWNAVSGRPLAETLPDPVRSLVLFARQHGIAVSATPLFYQDRIYCGYSLLVDGRHRIDVTAAAGFLFPFELAAPSVDRNALAQTIAERLDAEEPSNITDFESRYLASAMIASYYLGRRTIERETGHPG